VAHLSQLEVSILFGLVAACHTREGRRLQRTSGHAEGLNLCLEIDRGVQHPVQGDVHTFCLFSVLCLAMDSKRSGALERRLGRGWAFDSGVSFSRAGALRDERA
jgi:hypothetical protein